MCKLKNSDGWKNDFQGKIIFSRSCGEVLKGNSLSIRECYVDIALKEKDPGLQELAGIFKKM